MVEDFFLRFLSCLLILCAFAMILASFYGYKAGYGRYAKDSSISIPAKEAWIVQELPCVVFGVLYLPDCRSLTSAVVLLLFLVHYVQRSLVYPFLCKFSKKQPLEIFASALLFCTVNGYVQACFHAKHAEYNTLHMFKPSAIIGLILFFIGIITNWRSDKILRELRNVDEKVYKIPKGGMFEYISGANYFGEILEWIGFALFAQSLPAFAFAFFVSSNLAPRAFDHHRWYYEKFPDYPKGRKALIPYIA